MEKLPATTKCPDGVPYVGCAATRPSGSDCYPGTIVWVSDQTVWVLLGEGQGGRGVHMPRQIGFRGCDWRVVSGSTQDGSASYEYFDDLPPDARGEAYSWRPKRRGYVQVGTPSRSSAAHTLGLGCRRAYLDPSF
jgi:hypothetical protein